MARRDKRDSERSLGRMLAWAAITFAIAGVAGGTGYVVAAATDEASAESPPRSAAPAAESPRLLRAGDLVAAGRRAGTRVARPRALALGRRQGRMLGRVEAVRRFVPGGPEYRRIFEAGRRAGSRQALERFAFSGDGFYVIGVGSGGRRVGSSHGPLGPGDAYELCDGGRRACVRREGP